MTAVKKKDDYAKEWAKQVRKMTKDLAKKAGGAFIEKDEAIAHMRGAQYRVEYRRDRRYSTMPYKMIFYKGRWLDLAVQNLAGQVHRGRKCVGRSTLDELCAFVVYGAVATDRVWCIIDATSDG